MVTRLFIASSEDPDVRYRFPILVSSPFILIDTGRKKHVLLSSLEYGKARRVLDKKEFRLVLLDEYYAKVKRQRNVRKGSLLAWIAATYVRTLGVSRVLVSPRCWALHLEQLRAAGLTVEVSQTSLSPARAVKSMREVREIMRVRNATVRALRRCFSIVRESVVNEQGALVYEGRRVTAEFLKREARMVLLQYGCEAPEIIISHGVQAATPHDLGSGVLKAGEPLLFDFFPRSLETGYWFDMTRTICKGDAPKELRALYVVVRKAQDAALATIRPGVRAATVHEAAARVFRAAGYETTATEGFLHGTGHGVGLEIHEAPSLHEGSRDRLREGMVVTVEPGLYYQKIGGVRLENTVLVTKEGYRDLTRFPRRLVVE